MSNITGTPGQSKTGSLVSRRAVTRGVAWSAPLAVVAVAAPAYAVSTRKDPGINGWVQVSTNGVNGEPGTYNVDFNSNISGVGPDGAPYGLYLYDVNVSPADRFQNARMTFWLNDTQTSLTHTEGSGHGAGWVYSGSVGSQVKPDGFSYTGYRYTYNPALNNPLASNYDGVRLFLQNIHITLRADQVSNNATANMTYWVERYIEIQKNGAGAYVPTSFQRRNGQRGPLGNGFPGQPLMRTAVDRVLAV